MSTNEAIKEVARIITQENKELSIFSAEKLKSFATRIIGDSEGDLISKISREMDEFRSYIQNANARLAQKRALEKRLLDLRNSDTSSVEKNIASILNNNKITQIEIDGVNIIAKTTDLVCVASNGGKYKIGSYKIHFNARDAEIRFYNTNNDLKRKSYWSGGLCHHPHVSTNGSPCLGNSAEAISLLNVEHEYEALFSILLAYLESANLDDCAGRHVANWDLIDDEGNIIREGGYDQNESVFRYDKKDWTKDIIKYRHTCDHCGHTGENVSKIDTHETDTRWVCDTCYPKRYVLCSCGRHDTVERSRAVIKEDSSTEVVCRTCLEDYTLCKECKQYHHKSQVNAHDGICDTCRAQMKPCSKCGTMHKSLNPVFGTDQEFCNNCISTVTVCDDEGIRILTSDAYACDNCGDYVHTSAIVERTIGDQEYKMCKTCGGTE